MILFVAWGLIYVVAVSCAIFIAHGEIHGAQE